MAQQSPKKLLFIITKSNFGGAQKYVYDLATSLSKNKYDISVAFGGNGLLAGKLSRAGIKTFEIKNLERDIRWFSDLKSFFEIFSLIKKVSPDIVHLNSSKVGILGGFAIFLLNLFYRLTAKNYKLKAIYTAHGWAFKEKRKILQRNFIKLASWINIVLVDKVIAVSENDKKLVERWPFAGSKVINIHNGTKAPEWISKEESKKILSEITGGNFENKILIGTIAELHKNKGLEYLIKAIKNLLPEISCVIIGEGEEKENLKKLTGELGLSDRIFFAEFVEDASKYLKAFDIVVLSSLKEGLPYLILEAGMAEMPTIATSVGGISEIIEDMKSGILVQSEKPMEISKGIEYMLKNPEKTKEFASKLNKNVSRYFSLAKMVRETEKIYL